MMKYLTLDYIKSHSRIDELHEDLGETDLVTLYAESAEETVLNYLNRSLEDLIDNYAEVPAPVMHATLMLVDLSYMQRSPISVQTLYTVPYTFDVLLKPYMIL